MDSLKRCKRIQGTRRQHNNGTHQFGISPFRTVSWRTGASLLAATGSANGSAAHQRCGLSEFYGNSRSAFGRLADWPQQRVSRPTSRSNGRPLTARETSFRVSIFIDSHDFPELRAVDKGETTNFATGFSAAFFCPFPGPFRQLFTSKFIRSRWSELILFFPDYYI